MRLHYLPVSETPAGAGPRFTVGKQLEVGASYALPGYPGYQVSVRQANNLRFVAFITQEDVVVQRLVLGNRQRCFELDPAQPLDHIGETLERRIRFAATAQVPIVIDDGPACICQRTPFNQLLTQTERFKGELVEKRDGWMIGYRPNPGRARWPRIILAAHNANVDSLLRELSTNYSGISIMPA